MHKSGHFRFTHNVSLDSNEEGNDIGLFTFYRNQQEEEDSGSEVITKNGK